MKTKLAMLGGLAALALGAGDASAGGSEGAIGIGAESAITLDFGPPIGTIFLNGLSVNYDGGMFHAGGLVGFFDNGGDDDTTVFLGGRFYYHLHSTAMADFGVGANLTFGAFGNGNPNVDNPQILMLEPGVQTRAFIASNVALSLTAGLSVGLMDADGVSLDGGLMGGAGLHYYFF